MIDDAQAERILHAVLNLAVMLRDEGGPVIDGAARRVLREAGGDPVAALIVAAAAVRVDLPVDPWWRGVEVVARVAERAVAAPAPVSLTKTRRLRPCGTHAAYARHRKAGEEPCDRCVLAERRYQAARRAAGYRPPQYDLAELEAEREAVRAAARAEAS